MKIGAIMEPIFGKNFFPQNLLVLKMLVTSEFFVEIFQHSRKTSICAKFFIKMGGGNFGGNFGLMLFCKIY